jgi:NADH dehydrogenase [ubiquinone] 1 alpha subcomplex assembly factor 1
MSNLSARNLLEQKQSPWFIVNDDVMGGVSQSSVSELSEDTGIRFKGQLSLDNNGGFASTVLLVDEEQFVDAKAICLHAKGDGRAYQFRLKTERNSGGPSYVVEFNTQENQWKNYCFSVDDFIPKYRGRVLTNFAQLQFSKVKQLGLLIADKNMNPFQLDLRSIQILD